MLLLSHMANPEVSQAVHSNLLALTVEKTTPSHSALAQDSFPSALLLHICSVELPPENSWQHGRLAPLLFLVSLVFWLILPSSVFLATFLVLPRFEHFVDPTLKSE